MVLSSEPLGLGIGVAFLVWWCAFFCFKCSRSVFSCEVIGRLFSFAVVGVASAADCSALADRSAHIGQTDIQVGVGAALAAWSRLPLSAAMSRADSASYFFKSGRCSCLAHGRHSSSSPFFYWHLSPPACNIWVWWISSPSGLIGLHHKCGRCFSVCTARTISVLSFFSWYSTGLP